jgi:hypothetical protein
VVAFCAATGLHLARYTLRLRAAGERCQRRRGKTKTRDASLSRGSKWVQLVLIGFVFMHYTPTHYWALELPGGCSHLKLSTLDCTHSHERTCSGYRRCSPVPFLSPSPSRSPSEVPRPRTTTSRACTEPGPAGPAQSSRGPYVPFYSAPVDGAVPTARGQR